MNELPQGLDDVNVLARPRDHQLTALMQAVVEHFQTFEHVSPVLPFVIQPLVQHVHDLVEIGAAVVCDARNVCHICARRAPWVIGGGFAASLAAVPCHTVLASRKHTISHLDLDRGVALGHVLDAAQHSRHDGGVLLV